MTQTTCSGCPAQQGTHKPVGAVHQIEEPDQRVSDAAIDAVFNGMPDGARGFLKSWGYRQFARGVLALAAPATAHPDDAAVDALALRMKAKLAKQRAKGYGGWDTDCTQQRLSDMLRAHVAKGDPVDVANFCAFLIARGESIAPAAPAAQAVEPEVRSAVDALVTAAFVEGGVSAANTEAARQLTEQRKRELLGVIEALRATPPAPAAVAEHQAEYEALRYVFERARSLLRYDGVDQSRAIKCRDELIAAIEVVKTIDGGNWEAEAPMSDDDAAELILETMAVHCDKDAWHQAIAVHKVLLSRYVESAPQAQDVQDVARLDYLIKSRAEICHDETCADGYWLQFSKKDGSRWVQVGEFETAREAIDAAIAASAAKGGA